ncbi:hypothetical protein CBOM_01862 [Ceraceosorus bombacis]|uniref:Uncharacterized protein n=1 Tax=Ceraceosorus bombacis TaxID=401625 RepID=A0A0P1BD01_9BASI|nr:hypothetical protein CBOM_01862 [Ceraceosorus bombacis]
MMTSRILGERSINQMTDSMQPGASDGGKSGKGTPLGFRAPSALPAKLGKDASEQSEVISTTPSRKTSAPPMERFDSLQDLLSKAGYKETRIFTPQHDSAAAAAASPARSIAVASTASTKPEGRATSAAERKLAVAGNGQASTKRQPRPLAKKTSSLGQMAGGWLASFWIGAESDKQEEDPLPGEDAPTVQHQALPKNDSQSQSGCCAASENERHAAAKESSISKDTSSAPSSTSRPSTPSKTRAHSVSTPRTLSRQNSVHASPRRTANALPASPRRAKTGSSKLSSLWSASMRYRGNVAGAPYTPSNSRSVPSRLRAGAGADAAARALGGIGASRSKQRKSLVSAFGLQGEDEVEDPAQTGANGKGKTSNEIRKLHQQRRAKEEWRESVSSLSAFAEARSRSNSLQGSRAPKTRGASTSEPRLEEHETRDDAIPQAEGGARKSLAELFALPADPIVSRDDAVVLRSDGCLWPAGVGMRRMRSVEALRQAAARMQSGSKSSSTLRQTERPLAPTTEQEEAEQGVIATDFRIVFSDGAAMLEPIIPSAALSPRKQHTTTTSGQDTLAVSEAPQQSFSEEEDDGSSAVGSDTDGPPLLLVTSPTGASGAQPIDLGAAELQPTDYSPQATVRVMTKKQYLERRAVANSMRRSRDSDSESSKLTSSGQARSRSKTRRGRRRPKSPAASNDASETASEDNLTTPRPSFKSGRRRVAAFKPATPIDASPNAAPLPSLAAVASSAICLGRDVSSTSSSVISPSLRRSTEREQTSGKSARSRAPGLADDDPFTTTEGASTVLSRPTSQLPRLVQHKSRSSHNLSNTASKSNEKSKNFVTVGRSAGRATILATAAAGDRDEAFTSRKEATALQMSAAEEAGRTVVDSPSNRLAHRKSHRNLRSAARGAP